MDTTQNETPKQYHQPVMLAECLEALNIKPDGVYIDATFGGGGHSRAILAQLGEKGRLLAFDQDLDAQRNVPLDKRLIFVADNFENFKTHVRLHKLGLVDGILADLGVSSHQLDVPNRGFSFRFDAPLDMRMDTTQEQTAQNIVNTYTEAELKYIFRAYGEIDNAHKVAHHICIARLNAPIITTKDLQNATQSCFGKEKENKFFAKLFQALRIEINDELRVLQNFLEQTPAALKTDGRLVMMSYHSLEDRLTKNFMRSGNLDGEMEKDFFGNEIKPFKLIKTRLEASPEEQLQNPRSRSARLRVAQKI